jgi:thiol-disulfide isomerase/thioredoxin
VALLATAGCGTPTDDTAAGPVRDGSGSPTTSTTLPGPVEGVDLAGIRLDDLTVGGEIALADALDAPPGTPVLAFFWAPFCSSCRAEAPMLDRLAREQAKAAK